MQESTWQTPTGRTVRVLDPENSSEVPDWAGLWQPGQVIAIVSPGQDEERFIIDRPPAEWKMIAGVSDFDPPPPDAPQPEKPKSELDDIDALLAQLGIAKKPTKKDELAKIGVESLGGGQYSVSSGNAPRKQVRGRDAAILLALQRIAMASRGG